MSLNGTGGRIDKKSRIDSLVEPNADFIDFSLDIAAAGYGSGNMLVLRVSVDQADLAVRADVDGIRMQKGDTPGA